MIRHFAKNVAFIGWMIFRSPVLLPILQEHLVDNGGEVLPHIILFQIREWMELEVETRGETEDIRVIMKSLKIAFQDGDYELWTLVQTSFIDDLSPAPHPADRLKRFLEPKA